MINSDLEIELFLAGLRQALPGVRLVVDKQMRYGVGVQVFFPNGYGVSVQDIDSQYEALESFPGVPQLRDTPSSQRPLLELAVESGCLANHSITYKTSVADDVLPGLDAAEAVGYAVEVARLNPNAHTIVSRCCGRGL